MLPAMGKRQGQVLALLPPRSQSGRQRKGGQQGSGGCDRLGACKSPGPQPPQSCPGQQDTHPGGTLVTCEIRMAAIPRQPTARRKLVQAAVQDREAPHAACARMRGAAQDGAQPPGQAGSQQSRLAALEVRDDTRQRREHASWTSWLAAAQFHVPDMAPGGGIR